MGLRSRVIFFISINVLARYNDYETVQAGAVNPVLQSKDVLGCLQARYYMVNNEPQVATYVFETAFGWAAVTVRGDVVINVALPGISSSSELKNVHNLSTEPDKFCKDVIRKICRYFEGKKVDFKDIPVELPFGSEFSKNILEACRGIPYGKVKSYSALAAEAGYPSSARAAANVLSRNPLPLLIPCHRVIKADGKTGGFMRNIEGAAEIKKRMLELEKSK
jgi:methylated-DNA-[protein]-cysteine S-methyltransferase